MVLAQGIANRPRERREEFMADGRAELAAKVADWNKRRLAAEARGEEFDETPPMEQA